MKHYRIIRVWGIYMLWYQAQKKLTWWPFWVNIGSSRTEQKGAMEAINVDKNKVVYQELAPHKKGGV